MLNRINEKYRELCNDEMLVRCKHNIVDANVKNAKELMKDIRLFNNNESQNNKVQDVLDIVDKFEKLNYDQRQLFFNFYDPVDRNRVVSLGIFNKKKVELLKESIN
jgi:hypothetical protein